VRWRVVVCSIQLLRLLCQTLSKITAKCKPLSGSVPASAIANPETSAPPLPLDTLSLSQIKTVSAALQFVSGLGICPLLLPGVGIPLQLRSEAARKLMTKDTAGGLSNADRYFRLAACVNTLLDCFKQQALMSVILSSHLCDLLASLIQVCHSPLWSTYAAEFDETRSQREDVRLLCSHRNYADELSKLVDQVPSSSLVKELLLLQSGCPSSPDTKVCTP